MAVRAFESGLGRWVVSENGTWLPGVYDSEETAYLAAALSSEELAGLATIYRVDGEGRPVTAADLAARSTAPPAT